MNTKPTLKPTKRFNTQKAQPTGRLGRYARGVTNPEALLRIGHIAAIWPYIEQIIMEVFAVLAGDADRYTTRIPHYS